MALLRCEFAAPLIAAEDGSRLIYGLAVPYGVDATVSGGQRVRFEPGSMPLDGRAPRLLEYHDQHRPVGIVTARTADSDGVWFEARFSRTAAANDAFTLASDGVLDAVSVGVEVTESRLEPDGTQVVLAADWRELSLVPSGAFASALIHRVAATPPPTNKSEVDEMELQTPAAVPPDAAPAPTVTALAARSARTISAGEYLAAFYRRDPSVMAADDTTGDVPGILPVPIVGAVYDNLRGRRPLIDAVGVQGMPSGGKVFIRPVIVTHSSVSTQAAELDPLSSTALVIDDVQLTKLTLGGTVTLSEQVAEWTDPAIMQIIVNDLAGRYAAASEASACSSVSASSTIAGIVWTDPQAVVEAIYDAAEAIMASGDSPNAILVDPARWADLGKLLDTTGRPLFPALAPSNALGQMDPATWGAAGNPLGLRLVVSTGFSADTCFVANLRGLEVFEQQRGALQATDPSTLGITVSWRGWFVSHTIDDTKLVELTA